MTLLVKPYRETPGYCGPASLKMVLEYWGTEKSEKELGRLAHTTPEKGTKAVGLVKAACKLGFIALIKDNARFSDIKKYISKKTPVIVDWFSRDGGHYSVVVGIDAKHIYLMDPELARVRKIKLEDFRKIWFDFVGEYPRATKDIILRRVIVVFPKRKTPKV